MSTSPKKQSLISIDILRAVAALGVFYYHLHMGSLLSRYSGLNWLSYTDAFGAIYAVPLFFLISGYCIHLSNLKYVKANQKLPLKDYLRRRLLRIYPPYLVALVFSITVNYLVSDAETINRNDVSIHLLLLQGFTLTWFNSINVVLWTISIELAFYLLYPMFYWLCVSFSLRFAMFITLGIAGVGTAYFTLQGNVSLPQRYFATNLWFSWCCGAFIADKENLKGIRELTKPIYKVTYAMIGLGFCLLKVTYLTKLVIIDYQFNVLIWTGPLVLLINREHWFKRQDSIFVKILTRIGLSSYSLYLLHDPLISLKNFLTHKYLAQSLQPFGVFIGILTIPVIAWLSYVYIEKPFMNRRPITMIYG